MSLQTLPETSSSSTVLLRKPDLLRVRIGGESTDSIVPLLEGKTTIGSSQQCAVVLPSSDSRPLQCVIAVDAAQAEATRWGAGVRLNGRDFSKSVVAVGDKLQIGRCEIEFAVSRAAASPPPAADSIAATPIPSASADNRSDDQLAYDLLCEVLAATSSGDADFAAPSVPQLPPPTGPLPAAESAALTPADAKQLPTSQTFADELILELWQASEASRRRARALLAAARDARDRADAMAADLAAMEVELDLARAAYDCHAAYHEQLHLELIERDRLVSQVAPLAAEIDSLRSQLQQSRTELAEQSARCDELYSSLERQQSAFMATDATPAADAGRIAELEQSLAVKIEQAKVVARELGAARTELDGVRAALDLQTKRGDELALALEDARSETASVRSQIDGASGAQAEANDLRTEVDALRIERTALADRLGEAAAEIDRLHQLCDDAQRQVAELQHAKEAQAAEAPSAETDAASTVEDQPTADAASVVLDESAWNVPPAAAVSPEPTTPSDASDSHESSLQAWTPGESFEPPAPDVEPEVAPIAPPTPVETVPVASELAPTSFIDKYRHLLDDDGSAPAPTAAPVIDDEYLSPAQAADRTVPDDDSDEALDAYMASMMARMRSQSATSTPDPLPAPAESPTPPEPAPLDYDPSTPFDIESMKQGRRAPVSTDLAALRQIANDSARSAIATHHKKRKVESIVGKVVVAFAAIGTSGLLFWNAPSIHAWEFYAASALGLVGLGAAALAMRSPDRAADRRVDSHPGFFVADDAAAAEG